MKPLLTISELTVANASLHGQAFAMPVVVGSSCAHQTGSNAYDRYYPPYQLVPVNGTAQVRAVLHLTEWGRNFVNADEILFVTPDGLRYNASREGNTCTITLSGVSIPKILQIKNVIKNNINNQLTETDKANIRLLHLRLTLNE